MSILGCFLSQRISYIEIDFNIVLDSDWSEAVYNKNWTCLPVDVDVYLTFI